MKEGESEDMTPRMKRDHKLPRLVWPERKPKSKKDLEVVFDQTRMDREAAEKEAGTALIDFLDKGLALATEAMVLPSYSAQWINFTDEVILAKSRTNNQGELEIDLALKLVNKATGYAALVLEGEDPEEELIFPGEEGEAIKLKVVAGVLFSWCVSALAHEMYHARQVRHDPGYAQETLSATRYAFFIRTGSKEPGDELDRAGLGIYNSNLGERAANGLTLRFLKELKEQVLSKPDAQRSVVEKLFLSGVDEAIRLDIHDIQAKNEEKRRSQSRG